MYQTVNVTHSVNIDYKIDLILRMFAYHSVGLHHVWTAIISAGSPSPTDRLVAVSAYLCFINTLDFSLLDYSDEAFYIDKFLAV